MKKYNVWHYLLLMLPFSTVIIVLFFKKYYDALEKYKKETFKYSSSISYFFTGFILAKLLLKFVI